MAWASALHPEGLPYPRLHAPADLARPARVLTAGLVPPDFPGVPVIALRTAVSPMLVRVGSGGTGSPPEGVLLGQGLFTLPLPGSPALSLLPF